MQIIRVEAVPSKIGDITIGDTAYTMQVMYNQIADQWSFTIWEKGVDCPLIAGLLFKGGMNLIKDLHNGYSLYVIDKRGTPPSTNWFERLTEPLTDGLPNTFLVLGTDAEFEALRENYYVSNVQPFC